MAGYADSPSKKSDNSNYKDGLINKEVTPGSEEMKIAIQSEMLNKDGKASPAFHIQNVTQQYATKAPAYGALGGANTGW